MKNRIAEVPSVRQPIRPSPGFAKKLLSGFKLDIAALCGFGCRYCSSNTGNYLRINRAKFADLTEQQLGERLLPTTDPELMLLWPDVLQRLETQLAKRKQGWGAGKTLVFSMLTDGFSPELVSRGITKRALELVVERTRFRIRILTKNAIVGSRDWIDFFRMHEGRFVVGLSVGTLSDTWARAVEIGTSLPSARIGALQALQDAGVPTYGMLCPIFPDVLENDDVERLVDKIRPDLVEHVWAEPYNDRLNWAAVRAGYQKGTGGYRWLTEVFEDRRTELWSRYATDLYLRLRDRLVTSGQLHKLRYLLYEREIRAEDAKRLGHGQGILLQSKPGPDGGSQNSHLAHLSVTASVAPSDKQLPLI